MLRVQGESMIGAGILDGDYVVVRREQTAEPGDIVVAGIPGGEATVKTFTRRRGRVTLVASNPLFEDIELPAEDVAIYGKVVTVMRRL